MPQGSGRSKNASAGAATGSRRGGRRRKGDVVEWVRANGDCGYGVRFFDAEGNRRYERCGLESEGWSRRRAEIELENFVRLVEAGAYVPTPDAGRRRNRIRSSARSRERSRERSWPSMRLRSGRRPASSTRTARAAPGAVLRE